jgi:hypothetical protein
VIADADLRDAVKLEVGDRFDFYQCQAKSTALRLFAHASVGARISAGSVSRPANPVRCRARCGSKPARYCP